MNRNGWNQHALEKLYQRYQDVTGVLDFRPAEIATWAKAHHYTMPEPPTDVEMLTELLRDAALKARRKDSKLSVLYRAALSYPVKSEDGEWQMKWFDADGPTATLEKVLMSVRRRKDQALNILVSAAATLARWKRTHPKQTEQIDMFHLAISSDEVQWRLLGKNGEDEVRRTG